MYIYICIYIQPARVFPLAQPRRSVYVCVYIMYVCTYTAAPAPAHARTRAHRQWQSEALLLAWRACDDTCGVKVGLYTILSSLGRSLLPLWYLAALTKVHRPLLKILLSSQQLKKVSSKMFSGSTRLRR